MFAIGLVVGASNLPVSAHSWSGDVSKTTVSQEQKHIFNEFISIFENSSLNLAYDYVEALRDGRGYTAGRSGFTTRDGDLLQVVQLYLKRHPDSDFKDLVPQLILTHQDESGSLRGLRALPGLWHSAVQDPDFLEAQDEVSDQLYYLPALDWANRLNLSSAVSILCLYDAAIEHGVDGPDGLADMISHVSPPSSYSNELLWLKAFQAVRRAVLMNAADPETRKVWRDSVGRVDALDAVIESGNVNLAVPIAVNPFGDEFVITN